MVSFKIGRNKPEACSCCTSPPCPSPLARDALCQDFKSEMLATQLKEPYNSFCYGIGVGPSVKHVLRCSLNVFAIVIVFLMVRSCLFISLIKCQSCPRPQNCLTKVKTHFFLQERGLNNKLVIAELFHVLKSGTPRSPGKGQIVLGSLHGHWGFTCNLCRHFQRTLHHLFLVFFLHFYGDWWQWENIRKQFTLFSVGYNWWWW